MMQKCKTAIRTLAVIIALLLFLLLYDGQTIDLWRMRLFTVPELRKMVDEHLELLNEAHEIFEERSCSGYTVINSLSPVLNEWASDSQCFSLYSDRFEGSSAFRDDQKETLREVFNLQSGSTKLESMSGLSCLVESDYQVRLELFYLTEPEDIETWSENSEYFEELAPNWYAVLFISGL